MSWKMNPCGSVGTDPTSCAHGNGEVEAERLKNGAVPISLAGDGTMIGKGEV
jgi:hypothetical protein